MTEEAQEGQVWMWDEGNPYEDVVLLLVRRDQITGSRAYIWDYVSLTDAAFHDDTSLTVGLNRMWRRLA